MYLIGEGTWQSDHAHRVNVGLHTVDPVISNSEVDYNEYLSEVRLLLQINPL